MKYRVLFMTIIVALLTFSINANAVSLNIGGDIEVTTGEIVITMPSGQVPFYFFYSLANPNTTYRVQFDALFEVADLDGDGIYNQSSETPVQNSFTALAQMDWVFGEFINDTVDGEVTAVHFNITGSSTVNPEIGDLIVQFRNHVSLVGNSTELKFDVVINNYSWQDNTNTTMLIFAYKLIVIGDDNYKGSPDMANDTASDAVSFGSGFFESNTTAEGINSTEVVSATVSLGDGAGADGADADPRIYIAYSHFESDLVHDPTIGIDESTDDGSTDDGSTDDGSTDDGSTDDGTSEAITEAANFPLIAGLFIVIPVIMLRRYKLK